MDSKPTRGTRLPLSQIQQNVQPEKKSTFLKSTQRPLSVPNLKSLFNGKSTNDENKDIEKDASAHYVPTTYVPQSRKLLAKRNTIIFRDPILTTVEEIDDGPAVLQAPQELQRRTLAEAATHHADNLPGVPAPLEQGESIINTTKYATVAKQLDTIITTTSEPQIINATNPTRIHNAPPALSHVSEPEAQEILEAANAAEVYHNPPALPNSSEPEVQDVQIATTTTTVNLPTLPTISEPVVHKVSSSPELRDLLVVSKVRGPVERKSNLALPAVVDTRQVTSIYHGAPQQTTNTSMYQAPASMVSEDRVVTAFLRPASQPSLTANEAVLPNILTNTSQEDENVQGLGVAIPVAFQGRNASAMYTELQASAPSVDEASQPQPPKPFETNLVNEPALPDPDTLTGLRAAVAAQHIHAAVPRSKEPVKAPSDQEGLSVQKKRDITLVPTDLPYLQPLPWAPVMQPVGTHQYIDNCAAAGLLGPKAVESRYLTPHYTLPQELHSMDPSKEEDGYDSYDEDEGYTTARSYRSNGETTNDGATADLFPRWNQKARREIADATAFVESTRLQEDIEDEALDPTMVAEYADEIFEYLRQLEVKTLPNPFYMEEQNELQWSMRSVLMDWLVQVHSRCNLLPETLFITANFVDRFLSGKIVSLGKLQLVGATALFLAAKKEEINCPTLNEIVFMVDHTYTAEELIKAERYMLNILKWELEFPGPMSFLRRISKADDYDLETRTLAKYFLEVTMMEERFIGTPCSFSAAASHCIARLMLKKGHWTVYHIHYSNYTYTQLHPLLRMLLYCVENPMKHHAAVYEKYADKKFKRASTYVEVQMQRGFSLPNPPTSSNRNMVDEVVYTAAMPPYGNPINYLAAAAPSSGRVFST